MLHVCDALQYPCHDEMKRSCIAIAAAMDLLCLLFAREGGRAPALAGAALEGAPVLLRSLLLRDARPLQASPVN